MNLQIKELKEIIRMSSGIYTITNKINNKIYIGYCSNFINRKRIHFSKLKKNKHHSKYLQNAYNKYGESNFTFEILEECDKNQWLSQEHYWCNILNTHHRDYGYNMKPTSPNDKYLRISEESKKLIGLNSKKHMTGRKLSLNTRLKMSNSAKININNNESIINRKIKVSITYNNITECFDSITDLCKHYNFINQYYVGKAIKDNKLYKKKYIIKYINN